MLLRFEGSKQKERLKSRLWSKIQAKFRTRHATKINSKSCLNPENVKNIEFIRISSASGHCVPQRLRPKAQGASPLYSTSPQTS